MRIDKKFLRDALPETRTSVDLFLDRTSEKISYRGPDGKPKELETSDEIRLEGQLDGFSNLVKLDNSSVNFAGQDYDVYRFRSWAVMFPDTVQILGLGIIFVSKGNMFITKQDSNIAAFDGGGLGGYTNTSVGPTATMVSDGSTADSVQLAYLNQDNALPGLGVEYNGLYWIAANGGATFQGEVYIDIEFVVEKGAIVELL